MKINDKDLWEYHYSENLKYVPKWPDNFAIKFFGRLAKKYKLKNKKTLDLGCGGGKDLILIEKMGMKGYGIDISENAIKFAKQYIKEWNIYVEIKFYDGKKITYPNEYFDFVISLGVLDHMKFSDSLLLIDEVYRVLKPKGFLCVSLHSIRDSNYQIGKEIVKNSFIIEKGKFELGLTQHYYDEKEIKKLLENFKIEKVFLEEEISYNLENKSQVDKSSFWVIYAQK